MPDRREKACKISSAPISEAVSLPPTQPSQNIQESLCQANASWFVFTCRCPSLFQIPQNSQLAAYYVSKVKTSGLMVICTNRCIWLLYVVRFRMGSLCLHRSINSEPPNQKNLIKEIFSGNRGEGWKYFEIAIETDDLNSSDIFEVGKS